MDFSVQSHQLAKEDFVGDCVKHLAKIKVDDTHSFPLIH